MKVENWNIAMTFRLPVKLTDKQLKKPHGGKRGYKPLRRFVREFASTYGEKNVAFIGKYGLGGELGGPHIHLAVVVRGGKTVDVDYWEKRWIELHGKKICNLVIKHIYEPVGWFDYIWNPLKHPESFWYNKKLLKILGLDVGIKGGRKHA